VNRPRRKNSQPTPVGDILQSMLKETGLEKKVREYAALAEWDKIVGATIAEQTTPQDIKGGVLFIQVKNAAWRSQLAFFKDDIIQKVNAHAGRKIVRSIFFT
jgi:predicted nucleic acid-binding Zn ribbon protein